MVVTRLMVLAVLMILPVSVSYAQVDYAHYMESIQVVVEAGEVSAAVVLESTDADDIMLPAILEQSLRESERIIAVIFTDTPSCILGVDDEACIIVNMARIPEETNIVLVQDGAKSVADGFIDPLNDVFGVNARFHSVFVHHNDDQNSALGVPGIVAGYNTISVVYTAPQRGTPQFLEMILSGLLAPPIAEGGGFIDAARILASNQNATLTFVAVPGADDTRMMLRVTHTANHTDDMVVNPLHILDIDEVRPSAYFDDGFYPLNSLIRVAVSSEESLAVTNTDIIPMYDGKPEYVTRTGWFFDPPTGTLIRGTYLMGDDGLVRADETSITLEPWDDTLRTMGGPDIIESSVITAIIVAAGGGAAVFYLRGYRR